ncbi:MAG: hypothetical protein DRR19_12140 [Candidatus Parabeggiatoa sp. nov. 1]|nr:MAG: hypothetical protein DRR19_12140 [Gammaproteobacteria bacterium]
MTATFNLIEYELTVSNEGTGSGHITGQGIHCGKDCSKHYVKDTLVNLTAAPSAGSTFVGWRGACTGTTDCTVTMSAAQNVVATFNLIPLPEYLLTVSKIGTGSGHVTGNGIDCGNECTRQYVENTVVTLTAKPDATSTFAGWRGDCADTATCQVTMTAAQNITAIFNQLPPDEFALTINSVGNGRVTGNGIDCGSDCTELYVENTQVTLTATLAVGSTFVGWHGACAGTSICQMTMNQNQNVTATFESNEKVALKLIATPQPVSVGASLAISAQIQAGNQKVSSIVLEWWFDADFWQFNQLTPGNSFEQVFPTPPSDCDSHQGCIELHVETASPVSGTFEVATLNLTANKPGSTEVYFTEKTAVLSAAGQSLLNKHTEKVIIVITDTNTLTVTKDGTGEGSVTGYGIDCGPDCSERYEADRVVPLIATPSAGSTFAGWHGACAGTAVCQLTMSATQNVTATFNFVEIKQYALTVNHQGAGRGHVTGQGIDCGHDCAAEYDANTQVTLTANAEVGSYFKGWRGACSGNSHCIITLDQAQDVIAVFEQLPTLIVNQTGTGGGNITGCGSHCTKTYDVNTVVTLSATPNADSFFAGWRGDCAGTDECQVTITTNKMVTALFIKNSDVGHKPEEALPCPTSGLITITCNAEWQTLTDVTVVRASVANAVFAGTIYNYGWISNSTIQPGAVLIGGIVTGYMTNQGTMKDFDFRGARITGGTLSGDIINNSQVGGTFQNVHLAANTRISGGQLQGVIAGDENAPAWLENLTVKDNSQLSGVIMSGTVQLGEPVNLGKGVRFTHQKHMPTDLELMALLPDLPAVSVDCVLQTSVQRVDLSKDVLAPGEGILTAINALADFKNNGWVITQAADYGYLQLTVDVLRFAVQPISVTSTHHPAAMELLEQQNVRFVTDTGIGILAQPAVQAPCTLQNGLADLGLPEVILQINGNLRIPATDEYWYSARPDWVSIEVGFENAPGLFLMDSPHIIGVAVVYTIFIDNNGTQRQQFFYPAFAQPEVLYSTAKNVVMDPEGLVTFKLGKQNYHGVLDYLVTKGSPLTENQLQVAPMPDVNGDGKEDWLLIYSNGERQILFQSALE